MTIKECYDLFGGDYDDVIRRLSMDRLVEKFLVKFLDDPSMKELLAACEGNDIEEQFRAAHKLKGVTANLSLANILKPASELTEQLRPRTEKADSELLEKVKAEYQKTDDAIKQYLDEK